MRGPVESGQYTSDRLHPALDDHGVLASIGSVGDAYDNALAESFVDTFKTELIADRVWRTRAQLELAVVEYIGWFNTTDSTRRSVIDHRRVRTAEPAQYLGNLPLMNRGNQPIRSPRNPARLI